MKYESPAGVELEEQFHHTYLYGHHSFHVQLHSLTQPFEVTVLKEELEGYGGGDLHPPGQARGGGE